MFHLNILVWLRRPQSATYHYMTNFQMCFSGVAVMVFLPTGKVNKFQKFRTIPALRIVFVLL